MVEANAERGFLQNSVGGILVGSRHEGPFVLGSSWDRFFRCFL